LINGFNGNTDPDAAGGDCEDHEDAEAAEAPAADDGGPQPAGAKVREITNVFLTI
jgi:hypothetical protein